MRPKAKILLPRRPLNPRNAPTAPAPAPLNFQPRPAAINNQPRFVPPAPLNIQPQAAAVNHQPRCAPPVPVNVQPQAAALNNPPRNAAPAPVNLLPQAAAVASKNVPKKLPRVPIQPQSAAASLNPAAGTSVRSRFPVKPPVPVAGQSRPQDQKKSLVPVRHPANRPKSPLPPWRPAPHRFSSFLQDRSPSPISPTQVMRHLPFNSTLLDSSEGSGGGPTSSRRRAKDFAFPRTAFRRLVRGITEDYGDFRWQAEALDTIQEVAEAYLVKMFEVTNVLANHRQRVGIDLTDFQLAANLDTVLSSTAL